MHRRVFRPASIPRPLQGDRRKIDGRHVKAVLRQANRVRAGAATQLQSRTPGDQSLPQEGRQFGRRSARLPGWQPFPVQPVPIHHIQRFGRLGKAHGIFHSLGVSPIAAGSDEEDSPLQSELSVFLAFRARRGGDTPH